MNKNNLIVGMILAYFLCLMHIYIITPGGSGLSLPVNAIAWAVMALVIIVYWTQKTRDIRLIIITPMARSLLLAILLMIVPITFTSAEYRFDAFISLVGLVAGFVVYFTLLQCRFSSTQVEILLHGLIAGVLLIVIPASIRLIISGGSLLSEVSRGVFQQRNLTGTFMVTALGAALFFWLNGPLKLNAPAGRVIARILQALALVLVPFSLALSESRISVLAAIIILLGMGLLHWRKTPRALANSVGLIAIGLLGAYLLVRFGHHPQVDFKHPESNNHRMLMLTQTLAMISQHPIRGWGLGSFEYQFHHFLLTQDPPVPGGGGTKHPHNEILYGWMEGGICYLLAYILIAIAAVRLWLKARRRDLLLFQQRSRGYFLLMLPMVLHTQVELPFYLSATHWLVFLLLLALTDGQANTEERSDIKPMPVTPCRVMQLTLAYVALLTLPFLATTLQTGVLLTQAEAVSVKGKSADNFKNTQTHLWNPWIFSERIEYDQQVSNLLQFNQTHDDRILKDYLLWSGQYLQKHIDNNVFATRIAILNFYGKQAEAKRLKAEAHYIYVDDVRFMPRSS